MNILKWIDDRLSRALRKSSEKVDGRLITVVMVCAYFLLLFAGSRLQHRPYYQVWGKLAVPAVASTYQGLTTTSFVDLRSVLSCYDCTRQGYDVLYVNPCNPNRVIDGATPYPRIWWTLTPLGLSQRHTMALGFGLNVALFAGVLLFVGRLNRSEGVIYGLFLCSPPLMLLVERGNVDNIIFLALYVALLLSAPERSLMTRMSGYLLIFLAALFKLYPLAGLILLLKEKQRTRLLLALTFLTAFGAYYVSHRAEMRALKTMVTDTDQLSYGYKVIFYRISKLVGSAGSGGTPKTLRTLAGGLLALTFASAMLVLARRLFLTLRDWLRHPFVEESMPAAHAPGALKLDGFRLGAALYLLTFGLGSVYSYKLVFVVFALPQMLEWIKAGERSLALPARRLSV